MEVRSPAPTTLDDPIQQITRRVAAGEAVILFDGVCPLCNALVDFVIQRDPHGRFAFAALQSEGAQAYLARHGSEDARDLDTLVLIDADGVHERSTAALRILRGLPGGWPLLYPLMAVPESLRDAVYRVIAANRYRWFGRKETCRLPTPAEGARFV